MDDTDRFGGNGPLVDAFAVTPSDSTDLPRSSKALYIGGAGNVRVAFVGSSTPVTLTALSVGVWHRMAISRVYATSTTATGIVAAR